jgi:hypothetical protein
MNLNWKKKDYDTTLVREKNGVVWIEFQALQGLPVKHAYSTRLGGVSTGVCASMNLRNCEWDTRANYEENMRRFCGALGVPFNRIVASHQTHTTNVHVVTEADVPTGTLFGREFTDVDGLVTNLKNVPLVTSFADCIPLYLVDPVQEAIGISHAGWRGTVGGIGRVTIETMTKIYDTKPADLYACVGPGICQDCYEVSADVYEAFEKHFSPEQLEQIFLKKPNGKYQLDLWLANKLVLMSAGVLEEHIALTDLCTKCNSEYLFSHRVMGNRRGNQCGFLMLEED